MLLVDDAVDMRAYMRQCLASPGFELVEAVDGRDALSKMRGRLPSTPALVITDIIMPHMDGLALKAALGEASPWSGVPVLLITGEAKQYHQGPSLHKPFNARRLRAAVQVLLQPGME